MAQEIARIIFRDFVGLDLRSPSDVVSPRHLVGCENLFVDRGTLRLRGGRSKINANEITGASPVTGLYKDYVNSDLLVVSNGKLWDGGADPMTEIQSAASASLGGSTTADYDFATLGGTTYFSDGANGPWSYDGTNFTLIAAITSPATAPNTGVRRNFLNEMEDIREWTSSDAGNTQISVVAGTDAGRGSIRTGALKIHTTAAASAGDIVYWKVDEDLSNAQAVDGGAFTDESTEANNGTADDMTFWPASPATNDAYYFNADAISAIGLDSTSLTLLLEVSTAAVSPDMTTVWEYWNGSSWATQTTESDTTNILQPTSTGIHAVHFDFNSDHSTSTENGILGRWIRARITVFVSIGTVPLGAQAWMRNIPFSGDAQGLDLSGVRNIHFWINQTSTGTRFQFGFGETDPTTDNKFDHQFKLLVKEWGGWSRVTVPIDQIADDEKDVVQYFGFRVADDTVSVQLYIDRMSFSGGLKGTYEYRYSYYDSTSGQESGTSPSKIVEVENALKQIVKVSGWGAGGSADADQIRIYRRGGLSAAWRLVTTIDDSETSFRDQLPASLIGALQGPAQGSPPPVKYIVVYENRVAWANAVAFPSRLFLSNYEDPTAIPELTLLEADETAGGFIDVQVNDGDEITGLAPFADRLLVFKRNSTHALFGTSFRDFLLRKVSPELGCASHKSIAQYQNLLIWYTGEDIVQFDGSNITILSDPIKSKLDSIPAGSEVDTVGIIHDQRYYFFYRTSGSVNSVGLVYDLRRGGWTEHTGWTAGVKNAIVLAGSGDKRTLYAGDATDGFVWNADTGTTDDSSGIEWTFQTPDVDFGDLLAEHRLERYTISCAARDEYVSVLALGDQGATQSRVAYPMIVEDASDRTRTMTLIRGSPDKLIEGNVIGLVVSGTATSEVEINRMELNAVEARRV